MATPVCRLRQYIGRDARRSFERTRSPEGAEQHTIGGTPTWRIGAPQIDSARHPPEKARSTAEASRLFKILRCRQTHPDTARLPVAEIRTRDERDCNRASSKQTPQFCTGNPGESPN